MTGLDLAAIRERADAATPGPWTRDLLYGDLCGPNGEELFYGADGDGTVWVYQSADADFATHARTDIPALLDHVDNLEEGREIERRMLRNAVTRMEAARALHRPENKQRTNEPRLCEECAGYWPCATIQALEGETNV